MWNPAAKGIKSGKSPEFGKWLELATRSGKSKTYFISHLGNFGRLGGRWGPNKSLKSNRDLHTPIMVKILDRRRLAREGKMVDQISEIAQPPLTP